MVVIASRQPGARPETIRTRLARFMPVRSAAGWSLTWTAHTERPDEIFDEVQLSTAEHLGCFGAAVAHALAQVEIAPNKLHITAETDTNTDTDLLTITVEVRAQIPGIEQPVLEAIARRAEAHCSVWKGLASEHAMRIIGILEEAETLVAAAAAPKPVVAAVAPSTQTHEARKPAGFKAPKWLSLRLGVLMGVAVAAFAAVPLALPIG